MKTLYLDCGMGAAGDMLTAALLELLADAEGFLRQLHQIGLPGVTIQKEASVKCGIQGSRVTVRINGDEEASLDAHLHHDHHDHDDPHHHTEHHHHDDHCGAAHTHHHRSMADIEHIIGHLKLSPKVREDVLAVYRLIAEAESHAHGIPVSDIHFHEVGTLDAIADIAAVCLLMESIAPSQVVVSPIHVGSGHVHCAHGILPVPAPATAHILRGVPIYGGGIRGELCTPTGAALLRHFATSFGEMPMMRISAVGYGMGAKDFEAANCVRAMLGETDDRQDSVCELRCNLDDMTAEELGFATERLLTVGALDVWTIPAVMKKSRPGMLLYVLCRAEARDQILRAIFRHTSTIGVRETVCRRYALDRSEASIPTPHGSVRRKDSEGYGARRSKYEFDDLARIARANDLSLLEAAAYAEAHDPAPSHVGKDGFIVD